MIVFDFDGVICDSLEVCRNACQYAVGKQHSPILIETNPFRYLDPVTFETLASELGLNEPQFARDVGEFVSNNSTKTTFFYGIDAVVQQLSQSHRLFIVSASNSEAVRLQLVRHGLDSYFEDILGAIDLVVRVRKSLNWNAPTQRLRLWLVIALVISKPHESGSLSIAVTWGWQSQSYLEQAKPTAVAQNVSALTSIVHQLSDISELMA